MRLKNKACKKSVGTIISGIVLLFLGIYFATIPAEKGLKWMRF